MRISEDLFLKIKHVPGSDKRPFLRGDVRNPKIKDKKYYVQPRTVVGIIKGNFTIGVGMSKCSFEDNFCRVVGRNLATERAMKFCENRLSPEDKTLIIKHLMNLPSTKRYFNSMKKNDK